MELSARLDFITQVGLILLLVLISAPVASAQTGPRLTLDCDSFDFGSAPANGTLTFNTWLRAAGEDTVRIADVKTGCSCLMAPMVGREVFPGDSLLLTLYWRLGAGTGSAEREPYLFTEEETEPYRIWLEAQVTTAETLSKKVYCRPQSIQFGETGKRKDYRKIITIHNPTESNRAVAMVSYPDSAFTVQLPDSVMAGGSASAIVILSGDFDDKEFERSFTLEFTAAEAPASRVSIAVTRGDFSFRPTLTTNIDTMQGDNPKR